MPRDEAELWPLNDREVALWLLQKAFPGQGVASLGFSIRLPGRIELPVLRRAVRWLVQRHVPLRSSVRVRGHRPVRLLLDPAEVAAPVEILPTTPARLEDDMRAVAGRSFDLERDELVRFTVLELPDGSRELLVTAHHLVLDALSAPSFVTDLAVAYERFAATGQPPAEHAVSATAPETSVMPSAEHIGYWKKQIAGLQADAMMLDAGDYSGSEVSFAGGRYARSMSEPAVTALRDLRRSVEATENVVLLSTYLLLLHRHGAGDDLVAGVPVDLRPPGRENVIGHHFSVLPLRARLVPGDTFASFTARVLDVFFESLEHRDVSYETMAHQLLQDDYDWQAPFFRHLFNFWPAPSAASPSPDWSSAVRQVDTGYSRFDLEMVVGTSGGSYDVQIAHRGDVHDESFVRRFYDRYEALLIAAAADPGQNVAELAIATRHDNVIRQVNQTAIRWPAPHTVPGMVAGQVRAHPEHTAISSLQGDVSYGELEVMATDLAERLAKTGVAAGDVVAVTTGRSAATAAVVLAAWQLGAAYLPLNPAHPAERLRFQLADADVAALVGSADTAARLGFPGTRVVVPGERPTGGDLPAPVAPDPGWAADPGERAYVIYTSGSTGRPKGVQITHANLANVVRSFARTLDFGASRAMTWLTAFTFDISALELFLPLCFGGRAVVVDDQTQVNPGKLLGLVRDLGVDVLQATPTLWRMIGDVDGVDLTGRWLLSGGEPLTAALARRLLATGARVVNVYGPTETTIWSTAEFVTGQSLGRRPAVGTPIANTTIRVMSESGADCPVDIVGEVVIAGAGVGAGYLGGAGVQGRGFACSGGTVPEYRTGDLGLWRPDGRLELRGRRGRQVKVNGQRLELGEVEAVLEEHPGVTAAGAVISGTARGGQMVVAFVSSRLELTAEEVRDFAALRLPGYAIPGAVQFLDSLPVNGSGKVDYRWLSELAVALPAPAASPPPGSEAGDEITSWLTGVWRSLLDNSALHVDSNFFLSGGESLLAISIASQVREHYGVDIPLVVVFENPTPRRLGAVLNEYFLLVEQDSQ